MTTRMRKRCFECLTAVLTLLAIVASGCVPMIVGAGAVAVYGGYKLATDPRTTKQIMDDISMGSNIKGKLVSEPGIKSMNIDVDVFDADVYLSGFVPSKEISARVEAIASAEPGIKKVINNLKIKP